MRSGRKSHLVAYRIRGPTQVSTHFSCQTRTDPTTPPNPRPDRRLPPPSPPPPPGPRRRLPRPRDPPPRVRARSPNPPPPPAAHVRRPPARGEGTTRAPTSHWFPQSPTR